MRSKHISHMVAILLVTAGCVSCKPPCRPRRRAKR